MIIWRSLWYHFLSHWSSWKPHRQPSFAFLAHSCARMRKQWISIVGVKCRRKWLWTKICGRKLWTVNGSESVLRALLHGRTFDFRVHGPSLRPILTFFILVFFSFLLSNLKLPIMPFSYFVIQFHIKTFGEKNMI